MTFSHPLILAAMLSQAVPFQVNGMPKESANEPTARRLTLRLEWSAHTSARIVKFSRDGKHIAYYVADKQRVIIPDAATGGEMASLPSLDGFPTQMFFLQDSQKLAMIYSRPFRATVWNVATCKPSLTMEAPEPGFHCDSSDGQCYIGLSRIFIKDGQVTTHVSKFFDLHNGKEVQAFKSAETRGGFYLSPNGKWAVGTKGTPTKRVVWSIPQAKERLTIANPEPSYNSVETLRFSYCGETLAWVQTEGRIFDLATGKMAGTLKLGKISGIDGGRLIMLQQLPNERWIASRYNTTPSTVIIDAETGDELYRFPRPKLVRKGESLQYDGPLTGSGMAMSDDGRRLVVPNGGTIFCYDLIWRDDAQAPAKDGTRK